MSVKPNDRDLKTLLLLLEQGMTPSKISGVLGWKEKDTKYVIEHLDEFKKVNSEVYAAITEFLSKEKFRQQTLAEQVVEKLLPTMPVLDYVNPRTAITLPKPRFRKKPLEQEAVLLISDTHAGKLTPSYNISVFKERLENITKNTLEILLLEKKAYKVDVLNIFLLGDLVDGSRIYRNQQAHADKNVYDQIMIGVTAFEELALGMLPYFKKVKFFCVKGNHGRVAFEEHEKVNWDMFLYAMMRERFAKYQDAGNFEIHIAENEDYTMMVNITGTTFLLSHGEETKSVLSVPYYGLVRDAAALTSIYKNAWDIMCIGHFHQYDSLNANGKTIFVNGTTVTDDLFGRLVVKRLPGNKFHLFGVNPHHSGEYTFHYLVDATRRSYQPASIPK